MADFRNDRNDRSDRNFRGGRHEYKDRNDRNDRNDSGRPFRKERTERPRREEASERSERAPREERGDILVGRNAVTEALKNGRPIDTLYVGRGTVKGPLGALVKKAKDAGAVIKETDTRKLDALSGGAAHQGVVAIAALKEYAQLDDLFKAAEEKGETPFFIIADGLEDPHNLGAILRTAECAGAHGVILPSRRSVGLSGIVGKTSAGAVEYVPVCRVNNLVSLLEELKARGVWIYAADMDGQDWCSADLTGPIALVIGSEGFGVSRLVKENCDFILSLPMKGKINSLNASVACGILCYEAARQRAGIPGILKK